MPCHKSINGKCILCTSYTHTLGGSKSDGKVGRLGPLGHFIRMFQEAWTVMGIERRGVRTPHHNIGVYDGNVTFRFGKAKATWCLDKLIH
jgi:hypothetical protein